jgi:hypothetical protein
MEKLKIMMEIVSEKQKNIHLDDEYVTILTIMPIILYHVGFI